MNAEIVNISGEEKPKARRKSPKANHRRPSLERSRKKPFGEPSGEVTSPYPNVIIIIRLHVHDE
jgi:hypothetical protein